MCNITLIEATVKKSGEPVETGRRWVVSEDTARIILFPGLIEKVLKRRKKVCYIPPEISKKLFKSFAKGRR